MLRKIYTYFKAGWVSSWNDPDSNLYYSNLHRADYRLKSRYFNPIININTVSNNQIFKLFTQSLQQSVSLRLWSVSSHIDSECVHQLWHHGRATFSQFVSIVSHPFVRPTNSSASQLMMSPSIASIDEIQIAFAPSILRSQAARAERKWAADELLNDPLSTACQLVPGVPYCGHRF